MKLAFLPLILLIVPLTEIAVFVLVGERIGVLATIALVLATAVAGAILLRIQGFGVMERIRGTLERDEIPGRELVHGAMIIVAGILLLTPGFVTDTLGFLLFVPPIRDIGWRFLRERIVTVDVRHGRRPPGAAGPTIDLETEDYERNPDRSVDSPWKKGGD